jgi:glycosyltransferase involved in cell wall biosynthesis
LIDDGSDDGTYEKLAASAILPCARLIHINQNMGPAHARHVGISAITNPDTIVVLVDMDDALEPQALRVVANRYQSNPRCLMTVGNWRDQNGRLNPQNFYTADELNNQRIREVECFNATHLRTFRRKLYDAIREEDLLDQQGRWLETCTDVALMYPLLDQCWADEVEFISEPIYRYNRQHCNGTLARFGKLHKAERLAWLKSKRPKERFNSHDAICHGEICAPKHTLGQVINYGLSNA